MGRRILYAILVAGLVAGMTQFFASAGWAEVPSPPVNQTIGMSDVSFAAATDAECRACHPTGGNSVVDRHHLRYGQPIGGATPPYANPGSGTNWTCINCHGDSFILERDCTVCHTGGSPHHAAAAAPSDCATCHGSLVEAGGTIPSYSPSLVTPVRSGGTGLPLKGATGAGGCNYCHDAGADTGSGLVILTNQQNHHGAGTQGGCSLCHDTAGGPSGPDNGLQMRACETCHSYASLHSIQADSPNASNIGTIVVGGEDAGYGHVGRDVATNDSDCWGCHGFAFASLAPGSDVITPSILGTDESVVSGGNDTTLAVFGSAFTNLTGPTPDDVEFSSTVELTAVDGSTVALTPESVENELLVVTIPGDTPAGNYDLRAAKCWCREQPDSNQHHTPGADHGGDLRRNHGDDNWKRLCRPCRGLGYIRHDARYQRGSDDYFLE